MRIYAYAMLSLQAAIILSCTPTRPATTSVASPLTSAVQIGAESRMDEPVYPEQSGEQSQPFIAAGGPGAIVVWRDDTRPGFAVSNHPPSFSRLDGNGNLLDVLPVAITPPTPSAQSFTPWLPIAAWNGDRALVFWGKPVAGGIELQGSRVTSDGVVLDPGTPDLPGGINIAVGAGTSRTPTAAVPMGTDFLVFWQESSASRMTRVGRDGSVATIDGTVIGFPADGVTRGVLGAGAVTGGVLLVVSEASQLKIMKIDGTGAALSALSPAAGTTIALQSGIASSGSGGLVCWSESAAPTGQPVTIYGRRVGADGAWIDTAPFEVRPAGAAVGTVGAVWNGTGYACYWMDAGTRVRATFRAVAASGTPVGAAAVGPEALATAPVQAVQVVWTGTSYLAGMARTVNAQVGGESLKDRQDGVLARALGTDFVPMGKDATVVTTQPNQQLNFRAVGTPAAAYVAWQDDRQRGNLDINDSENSDTYAARVTVGVGGLSKTVVPLLTGADSQLTPAVGWDGAQFTVVYDNYSRATLGSWYVQHASAAGTATGSPIGPLKDTHVGGETTLVWNGQSFLVASLYNANSTIVLFRLSATGVQLDAQAVIVSAGSQKKIFNLQGVAIGGTVVLVFQTMPTDTFGAPTGEDDVQALVVNADGTLPTTTPTAIASSAGAQDMPALATDGTSAVVVWRDRGGAAGPAIAGARIDASLSRIGTGPAVIAQVTAPDALGPPALAWTGSAYVAVWPKASGGMIAFAGCVLGADQGCAPGSESATPGDVAVSSADAGAPGGAGATDDLRAPVLAWTDSGGVLFYRRLDTAPYVNRERVFVRPILSAGGPAADGGADGPIADGGAGANGAGGSAAGGAGGGRGGAGATAAGGAGDGGASGGGAAGVSGTGGVAGAGQGGFDASATTGTASANDGGTGPAGSTGGARGDAAGSIPTNDSPADAGKPASRSARGCACAIGDGRQSSLASVFVLAALVLLRRRRISLARMPLAFRRPTGQSTR